MSRGFTLLEVLIAVAITAMIGIGSVQLLSNIIETRRATDIRAEQLASLQRFNQVLGRDIEQIINRSIRDEFGSTQPALVLGGSDYLLSLRAQAGAILPLSKSRGASCNAWRIVLSLWITTPASKRVCA